MSFPRYERYKNAGIGWLSEVPAHWQVLPNKAILSATNDLVGTNSSDFTLLSLTLFGIIVRDIDSGKGKFPAEFDSYKAVEANDLIFCLFDLDETPRTIGLANQAGMITGAYEVLRCKDLALPSYICYFYLHVDGFKGLRPWYTGLRKVVRPDTFMSIKLALPPLDEQVAISSLLDSETTKIDGLIEEQRRLIELLKEKRLALISHTVTKGLDPNAPMKHSEVDWIGHIPKCWEISKLGQIANIVRGGSPRPAGDSRFFNGDYMPWITVGEVTKDDSMHLVATESMLTEVGAEQSRTIDSGTLVLTNSGATLGVPKILGIAGCANDGILAFLDLKANANKKYLYFVLSSLTAELRERMKQGSGQPNLNTGIVSALQVPLPPVVEQLAIVAKLERMQDEFAALMAQAETSVTLLQERRSALISAAVTGKIDVRN